MPVPRAEWLALTAEEPLDPTLPICDPHHHLWEDPRNRYMLEELAADVTGGHNVVSTVFVECTSGYRPSGPQALRPVGETAFVESLAQASSTRGDRFAAAAGIVGFADLALGEAVRAVLQAHLEESPGRFKGIRHACGWDASPDIRSSHTAPPRGLLGEPRFREGFACLERLGLSFDAWLYHPQIPELTALAEAFPGTSIVLDHVGGPLGIGPYAGKRDEVLVHWRESIRALARCPNVSVKLGGLVMPVNGFGWHKQDRPPSSAALAAALAPYVEHCIEQFGAERCMFESNFPVDKVSCSYRVLWNAFKRLAQSASAAERAALFHDSAVRFYRL